MRESTFEASLISLRFTIQCLWLLRILSLRRLLVYLASLSMGESQKYEGSDDFRKRFDRFDLVEKERREAVCVMIHQLQTLVKARTIDPF